MALELADPAELAADLLAGPLVPEQSRPLLSLVVSDTAAEPADYAGPARYEVMPETTDAAVDAMAPQLSGAERRLLRHAIDYGTPVRIHYTNVSGNPSERIIEPMGLVGKNIEAWCRLREDERMFNLDRIDSVAPV